ncbi:hypothetical protein GPJ56_002016 [Histomonas meleagridis]|uniref:uncharacterized protein n=1 Tax=Histomonas meleagridis TaxID=135588 RepID=UPI00355A30C9|nr:hypothetical protein GPJ56_002016 [Histomonas meleagridis]KAH0800907.1 hypothetical protein GO595_006223 [Histomonas meleagridis]
MKATKKGQSVVRSENIPNNASMRSNQSVARIGVLQSPKSTAKKMEINTEIKIRNQQRIKGLKYLNELQARNEAALLEFTSKYENVFINNFKLFLAQRQQNASSKNKGNLEEIKELQKLIQIEKEKSQKLKQENDDLQAKADELSKHESDVLYKNKEINQNHNSLILESHKLAESNLEYELQKDSQVEENAILKTLQIIDVDDNNLSNSSLFSDNNKPNVMDSLVISDGNSTEFKINESILVENEEKQIKLNETCTFPPPMSSQDFENVKIEQANSISVEDAQEEEKESETDSISIHKSSDVSDSVKEVEKDENLKSCSSLEKSQSEKMEMPDNNKAEELCKTVQIDVNKETCPKICEESKPINVVQTKAKTPTKERPIYEGRKSETKGRSLSNYSRLCDTMQSAPSELNTQGMPKELFRSPYRIKIPKFSVHHK